MTISSKCQRALARGRLCRRLTAAKRPNFRNQRRFVRNINATLSQQILYISERQREPGIQPDCVLDDLWRKAMTFEGNLNHAKTVTVPTRLGHRLNVSMPTAVIEADELAKRRALMVEAMDVMNARERRILTARRLQEEPLTLEDLSHEYGISRERVRQIEVRAVEKLQKAVLEATRASSMPHALAA